MAFSILSAADLPAISDETGNNLKKPPFLSVPKFFAMRVGGIIPTKRMVGRDGPSCVWLTCICMQYILQRGYCKQLFMNEFGCGSHLGHLGAQFAKRLNCGPLLGARSAREECRNFQRADN